jgi:hypothetical protein
MGGKAGLYLILGSHAHVSCGAAEHEFQEAYEKKLRPFVSGLCKYPRIHAVLHYSGVLLHWVERNHPELFMLMEDLVSRRQVEILGGGFYEPILPLIPPQDRIGQIELLTTYLRRHFGKRPQGCWIPALAWEQHLVGPLAASGMGYTFLSEDQFRLAGFSGEDLFSPCISEDQGKLITVFPIARSVEAALAEKNIPLILEELKNGSAGEGEKTVAVCPARPPAGEGESADYAWNRFFEELSLSEGLFESVNPGKLLKKFGGLKKAGFPDSAGLGEDESPVPPRRFIIEHPEANGIYSKMIFTNVLINQLRGDKSRKQNAREELWKAQDCGLFHAGPGRGLYRNSFRKSAYRALLGAERITREKGKFSPSLIRYDFDLDGEGEYLFQDSKINCYIQLAGAGIFELDYLPKGWNYLDSGSDSGPAGLVRRTAFADRLLPAGTGAEDLRAGIPSGARLCLYEKFEAADQDRSRGKVSFTLPAVENPPFGGIEIEKKFSLKKDVLAVGYTLRNRGGEPESFCLVSEINLSFAGEGAESARFLASGNGVKDAALVRGTALAAESLKIQDLKNEAQLNFSSAKAFDLLVRPLCLGGGQYQASRVMPLFAIELAPGESWTNEFTLKFSH